MILDCTSVEKVFDRVAIIDGSYMLHRSLKQPDLWDLKLDDGTRTGGVYGFLRIFQAEIKALDYVPVVVFDAGLSQERLEIHPNYKRNFEKIVEDVTNKVAYDNLSLEECLDNYKYKIANQQIFSDAVEAIKARVNQKMADNIPPEEKVDPKDEYGKVYHDSREMLRKILGSLGVPTIYIKGWEGDDIMALLTRMSKESIVLTDDRDLIQLISPTVKIRRPMAKQTLEYNDYILGNGMLSSRELVYHKAIVGDGSDNIPSVTNGLERKYSLGSKRAEAVARLIYECNEDSSVYLPKLEETKKNYYLGFVQRHEDFLRNMKLVDLDRVENNPEVLLEIERSVMDTVGKCNMFNAMAILGAYKITSVDVNPIIQKMTMMSGFLKA